MILIMALLDTIGVASVLPFMAVLADPEIIQTNIFLNNIFITSKAFGVESELQFIFFLGIFLFLVLVTSLIFKSITIYTIKVYSNASTQLKACKKDIFVSLVVFESIVQI